MVERLKSVAMTIAGLAVFVGLFFAYNMAYNMISPIAIMSTLEGGHWAGYYNTANSGKVWCLCKFFRSDKSTLMVMLSPGKTTDVFAVRRESDDENFAHLYMDSKENTVRIEAKQLYLGKRYILQRLMVGRFSDFWERNSNDAIRGNVSSLPGKPEFAVERSLQGDRAVSFCNQYVLGEAGFSSLKELDSFLEGVAARYQ